MFDGDFLDFFYRLALFVQVLLLMGCAYRAAAGPTLADRLLAIDMITTILIGVIIVLALMYESENLIDIGVALAALSFIAMLGLARYISEGKVF